MPETESLKPTDFSLMTSAVISVIRDRAISGCYGLSASLRDTDIDDFNYEPLYDVLNKKVAERLINSVCTVFHVEAFSCAVFGVEGDLLSQLYRLLAIAQQYSDKLEKYIVNVDSTFEKAFSEQSENMDSSYIRHIRNAVCHCRYKIEPDRSDLDNARIVLYDGHGGEVSFELRLSVDDINFIIDTIIKDVFIALFDDAGWTIKPKDE